MPRISEYHKRQFDRQGCSDWDEYCNINMLNYEDLIDDDYNEEDFEQMEDEQLIEFINDREEDKYTIRLAKREAKKRGLNDWLKQY